MVPGTATPQLGNVVVDTTADGNDGECAQDCTLREAIAVADGNQAQWVQVPPGVYRLTLGPLTLQTDTVFGASFAGSFSSGARSTVIDARGASRAVLVPAGSSSVVAGLTITGGNADSGGGVLVANQGQLAMYDTIVKDNVASVRGGGVANLGNLSIFGSTLTGNRAAQGGAVSNETSTNTNIHLSTLSANTAASAGGGIAAAGSTLISRTTFVGNTAVNGGGFFDQGGAVQLMWGALFARNSSACGGSTSFRSPWSSNLSDDSTCAFQPGQGTVTADPLVGGLANNGGPTDTHALRAGSPAINQVDPNFCVTGSSDQRHAPSPDACDVGSYEFGAKPPEAQLPPPQSGETVNVSRARGTVKVRLPGSDEFFELQDGQQVPVGSTFDTSKGRVNLWAAGGQRGWFYQGVFRLGQTKGRKPLSTMTLSGRLNCSGGQANVAQRRKRRRLWGDARGRFRTRGTFSSSAVRGTRWLVEDRCNATLTRVTKGRVAVRDFVRKRTVIVRAGSTYLAKRRR